MGFLDDLKGKAEQIGEKAKEGFGAAKDKASDLVEGVKDRRGADEKASGDGGDASADYSSEASAVSSPADEVGDVGHAPVADPLDPAVEAVDPVLEPVEPTNLPEDPLEPRPDRTS